MEIHLKKSEIGLFKVLNKAFTSKDLSDYIYDVESYLVEETDQLEVDNPKLHDYIQDTVPTLIAEDYDATRQTEWLRKLKDIIIKAKTMIN